MHSEIESVCLFHVFTILFNYLKTYSPKGSLQERRNKKFWADDFAESPVILKRETFVPARGEKFMGEERLICTAPRAWNRKRRGRDVSGTCFQPAGNIMRSRFRNAGIHVNRDQREPRPVADSSLLDRLSQF